MQVCSSRHLQLERPYRTGNSNGADLTHTESTFAAGDTLTLESGRDTNLKGAIVQGNTVIADIGRNLNLQSEQDSSTYKAKQQSAAAGISVGLNGKVGGNLSGSKNNTDSTYQSVIEQTAINAGSGGFDIHVNDNTDLKGAVIDSTLAAQSLGNNRLVTGTLTTSDIENKGSYQADSSTLGVNFGGNLSTGTGKPAGGSKGGSPLDAGLGGMAVADSGNASGTTKAAIAQANITITDEAGQKAKTGKTAAQTVAALDRDTANANGSIQNPFNQQKVQEQLEFLQVAGEEIVKPVAAKAAEWIGDTFKPDPNHPDQIDPAKVAAHAALGAAISQLLGTGWQTGATAGALGDILPNALAKAFEKDPATGKPKNEEAFKAATAIISAALTSATGGDLAQTISAGMITQNAVANNWLKHQEIKVGNAALSNCDKQPDALNCKAKVTDALQSLDKERENQKTQAEYLAKNAYDMEVRRCEGDTACISKYQGIRLEAESYLHSVYVQYVSGEISTEKFSGGMEVALKLAAEGAGGRIDNLRNLTWDQVKQGLIASYDSVKTIVTADVPAFEIDKAFGEFVNNAQTDKGIGGLAFDNTLGMVVGYAGGKIIGWTAEKGWEALAPAAAQQAEQFLKSQGAILYAVPEDGRLMPGPVFKTTAEATKAAKNLGYIRINETIKGEAVYKKGNFYITRDKTGHIGGAWKGATSIDDLSSKSTRAGTYDIDLNPIGD